MIRLGMAVAMLALGGAMAEAGEIKVGDAAPSFAVQDDTGATWKSADHFGKKIVVVYFYPADMTGGCTKQACGFRDDFGALKDLGVEVVGVSGDTVENHQVFKKAKELNFTLLADTEGVVAEAFGVPVTPGEKSVTVEIEGAPVTLTRALTTKRWTFVVDASGKVVYKDDQVAAAEDSQKIIAAVKKLQK